MLLFESLGSDAKDFVLDGELYAHGLKLQEINKLVRNAA